MKKGLLIAFCILAVCSVILPINVVTIKAAESGYERTDYTPDPDVTITIDGKWTTTNEWTLNGEVTLIDANASFRSVWTMVDTDVVYDTFLVEFFSDNTTDAGDYWQICIDGNQGGGATPQADDYRIDIVGHTTLTVYQGTGSGWTATGTPSTLEWADSLNDSPTNSTSHYMLEITFLKSELGASAYWNFRLAVYDESTDTLLAWPPTPQDEPDRWGVQNYVTEVVPEGFSLGVVVLLSSVAVVVGFYCLRKRSKIDKYSLGQLSK
jgi:hypothetical protein